MTQNLQIDNATHHNAKREKQKAEKALLEAKKINKKPIFIPKGMTGEMLIMNCETSQKKQIQKNGFKGKEINHDEVLKLIKQGLIVGEIATKFNVSRQAIYYIKNKIK